MRRAISALARASLELGLALVRLEIATVEDLQRVCDSLLGHRLILPVGVPVRIYRESLSPAEGTCDYARGNLSLLLHEAMRDHDKSLAMEEVEHPVVDVCMLRPELVDPVPHQIGFGSSELVAQLGETTKPDAALRSRLGMSSSNH